jgi:hypothetical protein
LTGFEFRKSPEIGVLDMLPIGCRHVLSTNSIRILTLDDGSHSLNTRNLAKNCMRKVEQFSGLIWHHLVDICHDLTPIYRTRDPKTVLPIKNPLYYHCLPPRSYKMSRKMGGRPTFSLRPSCLFENSCPDYVPTNG